MSLKRVIEANHFGVSYCLLENENTDVFKIYFEYDFDVLPSSTLGEIVYFLTQLQNKSNYGIEVKGIHTINKNGIELIYDPNKNAPSLSKGNKKINALETLYCLMSDIEKSERLVIPSIGWFEERLEHLIKDYESMPKPTRATVGSSTQGPIYQETGDEIEFGSDFHNWIIPPENHWGITMNCESWKQFQRKLDLENSLENLGRQRLYSNWFLDYLEDIWDLYEDADEAESQRDSPLVEELLGKIEHRISEMVGISTSESILHSDSNKLFKKNPDGDTIVRLKVKPNYRQK